jgi:urease accessory protein
MTTAALDPVPARVHHGGPRLQPAHFEPDRVPAEVTRFGPGGGALGVGRPGKVGVLELAFEVRGAPGRARTELVHHYQKAPLQIMRPLYFDEARPDLPYTYLLTTGGGVLHGDRHRTDLTFGPGTSAHVTTQAHTKLYRMDEGYATALVNVDVGPGALVEIVPDPVIPYAGSRYFQRTRVTLDPTATFVYGETLYAGRLSRGERHEYDVYATDLDVLRPDGTPLLVDRVRLTPDRRRGLAVLDERDVLASLYVIAPGVDATVVADCLHAAVGEAADGSSRFGVSVLPGEVGAWLRLVGDDTVATGGMTRAAWAAARVLLTGRPAPRIRK